MNNKVMRMLTLLGSLPREPRSATTTALHDRLREQGHDVDIRTVERYMQELETSSLFGGVIRCDDRQRPYSWSLRKDRILLMEQLEPGMAATWMLVEQYVHHLLPPSVRSKLEPIIDEARRWLRKNASRATPWSDKVSYIPRGMPLEPATVHPGIFENVQEALFRDCQLEVEYRGHDKPLTLDPRAFVDRGVVSYLVASCEPYEDFRLYAMHRIRRATVLDSEIRRLPFSLEEYKPVLNLPHGRTINLQLRFYNNAGYHLTETPIEPDQKIRHDGDGVHTVTARVDDTSELHWWIQGFGANVEVLQPKGLRDKIGAALEEAAGRYR